jgi:hypothetical protein
MSFLPSFSNIVHKIGVEVALFNQLKAGLKESNRKRIPFTIQANNTPVVEYIVPWDGSVEGIIAASPTAATVSSSGNTVTMTVINKNGTVTLFTADTYANTTELGINTGAAFFNTAPAMSNGARNPQFKAGDVITFNALVTGAPGITSSDSVNVVLTLTPTDPKASF